MKNHGLWPLVECIFWQKCDRHQKSLLGYHLKALLMLITMAQSPASYLIHTPRYNVSPLGRWWGVYSTRSARMELCPFFYSSAPKHILWSPRHSCKLVFQKWNGASVFIWSSHQDSIYYFKVGKGRILASYMNMYQIFSPSTSCLQYYCIKV